MKIRPVIYGIQLKALDLASHEFEDGGIGGIARFNELFAEKFAELIVKECVDIVASRPYIDDGKWNHPSIMIRQHFGVE